MATRITKVGQDACLEEGCDVLILVKNVAPSEIVLAREAKALGAKVVLDLCDNLFFWPEYYRQPLRPNHYQGSVRTAECAKELVEVVDVIVVPTESLRRRLLEEFPNKRIEVIPDAAETEGLRNAFPPSLTTWKLTLSSYFGSLYVATKIGIFEAPVFILGALFRRLGLKLKDRTANIPKLFEKAIAAYGTAIAWLWPGIRFSEYQRAKTQSQVKPLNTQLRSPKPALAPGAKKLLWFGNSGIEGVFGLSELRRVLGDLERVHQTHPISLTVVTDSDRYFPLVFEGISFPVRFVPWSLNGCPEEIKHSDVVLLPNSDNDFAKHKSANRAVLALSLGKPVVASRIESLAPLEQCLLFDSFETAILKYLHSRELVQDHVTRATTAIEQHYSLKRVASLWAHLIEGLVVSPIPTPVLAPGPVPS